MSAVDLTVRNEARRPGTTLERAVAEIEAGADPGLILGRLGGPVFMAAVLAYELRGLEGLRALAEGRA
jgi:hypothetical protein